MSPMHPTFHSASPRLKLHPRRATFGLSQDLADLNFKFSNDDGLLHHEGLHYTTDLLDAKRMNDQEKAHKSHRLYDNGGRG